jgi:hypothetical protein
MIYRKVAVLMTASLFAAAAAATTVPSASVDMFAGCTFEADSLDGDTPGTVACSAVRSSPAGTVVNTATVSSVGIGTPAFLAPSSVVNTDPALNPFLAAAEAGLFVTYSFVVQSTQPTPFEIAAVPIIFASTGFIERQGDTFTWGQVSAELGTGRSAPDCGPALACGDRCAAVDARQRAILTAEPSAKR